MDIVEATRTQSGFVSGVSTRGALALYQAAQAYASLQGREYVIPEDIKGWPRRCFLTAFLWAAA